MNGGRYAVPWTKRILQFCGTDRVVQSAIFFWSSRNVGHDFVERFQEPLMRSKHLEFCRDMNLALINHYEPSVVITAGIGDSSRIARLYDLDFVEEERSRGRRLIARYDLNGTPWIFTRHWSGARPPLSKAESSYLRSYLNRFIDGAMPNAASLDSTNREDRPEGDELVDSSQPVRRREGIRARSHRTSTRAKDFTRYQVNGSEPLSKRHTVLEIVRAWKRDNPTATLRDFEGAFSAVKHPSGLLAPMETARDPGRRFIKSGETIDLQGIEYALTNQWGGDAVFEALLDAGRGLGVRINAVERR